jgi:hypothetical protein
MAKPNKYSTKEVTDSIEELNSKLYADLRKKIRSLSSCSFMSPQFLEMSEIFSRLANISNLETSLAPAKQDSTLWETEEQAIRFLIEDGKLNLCLRSLIAFKKYQLETLESREESWVREQIKLSSIF